MSDINKMITIIVPVYNSAKTIEKCIKSILNQSYKKFKLIIVNDGSTDNTSNLLKKFKDIRIKVINQSNKGVSAARNKGLDYADSKFVTFIDADDYVGENYLINLLAGFSNTDVELSITGINHVLFNKIYSKKFKSGKYSRDEILNSVQRSNGVMGFLWNKLWLLNIIKKYDIRFNSNISMAEDMLFTVNYINHIESAYVLNTCDYYYVDSPNSLSKSVSIKELNKNYKKGFIDYLKAEKYIEQSINSNNISGKYIARANIALTKSRFIRRIQCDKSTFEERKLKSKLIQDCIKDTSYVLSSYAKVPAKEKCVFLLSIYFSPLVKIFDRFRYKR